MAKVAQLLGVTTPESVRKWVRQAEVDAGARVGVSSEESAELKRLKRESAELRRANSILKAASAFFASMSSWETSAGLARFFAAPPGGFSAMCRPAGTGDLVAVVA